MNFKIKEPGQPTILDEDSGVELIKEPPWVMGSLDQFCFEVRDPAWLPSQGANKIMVFGDWLQTPIQIEVDGKPKTIGRLYGMSLRARQFAFNLAFHARGGGRAVDEMQTIIRGALTFYITAVV